MNSRKFLWTHYFKTYFNTLYSLPNNSDWGLYAVTHFVDLNQESLISIIIIKNTMFQNQQARYQFRQRQYVSFNHEHFNNVQIKFKIFDEDSQSISPRLSYQYIEFNERFESNTIRGRLKIPVKNSYFYIINTEAFYAWSGLIKPNANQVLNFIISNKHNFICEAGGLRYIDDYITNLRQDYKFQFDPIIVLFQALGAAKIIELIKQGHYQNIEQAIESFWTKNELNWKIFLTQQDIQQLQKAQRQVKDKLKGMFSHTQSEFPHYYDAQIFDQNRFKSASLQNDRLVYHITPTTQQIFDIMNIHNKQGYKNLNMRIWYLHGLGGIGKSISTSLLVELHNYIERLRYYMNEREYRRIVQDPSISWDDIKKYPKYFYFSIRQNDNAIFFYETIIKQLPYHLRIKKFRNSSVLSNIQIEYKKKNIRPIYIIDQINIFCSLLRSMKEGKHSVKQTSLESIHQIEKIIKLLKQYDVVFNSSQNAQRRQLYNYISKHEMMMTKVNYQKRLFQFRQLGQIISIIKFQYINQKAKYNTPLNQLRQYKFLFNKINQQVRQQNIKDQIYYLSQLTHLRIKQSIKLMIYQSRYSLTENDYLEFLKEIHGKSLDLLQEKYKKFLLKGDQQVKYKKFKLLHKLIEKATKQNLNQDSMNRNYFMVKLMSPISEQDSDQLFKQLAEVFEDTIIKIYLSPQTFLKITSFVNEQQSFTLRYANQILQYHLFDPVIVGRMLDSTYINLLSKYQKKCLYVHNKCFSINILDQSQARFFGFGSILTPRQKRFKNIQNYKIQLTKKSSVYMRFCLLFQELERRKNNIKLPSFFCGIPKKLSGQHHINSQCIDFLLIQLDREKLDYKQQYQRSRRGHIVDKQTSAGYYYNLYTFDFCVSFEGKYIEQKMQNATLFFEKFALICQQENKRFANETVNIIIKDVNRKSGLNLPEKQFNYSFKKIIHTFLVPQKMMQKNFEVENQYAPISCQFYPLQKIQFDEDFLKNKDYKTLFDTLKVLMNRIKAIQKDIE